MHRFAPGDIKEAGFSSSWDPCGSSQVARAASHGWVGPWGSCLCTPGAQRGGAARAQPHAHCLPEPSVLQQRACEGGRPPPLQSFRVLLGTYARVKALKGTAKLQDLLDGNQRAFECPRAISIGGAQARPTGNCRLDQARAQVMESLLLQVFICNLLNPGGFSLF